MAEETYGEDESAPVFFLSYARTKNRVAAPPRDTNQKVFQLFVDLSDHVVELLGLDPGRTAGFMDRLLDGGQVWTEDLAFAAGHCQVFIPLISPQYLNSAWCAKEWHAFTRRQVLHRPGAGQSAGETPVIPVNWSVVDSRRLPAVVSRRQMFNPTRLPPDIAPQYHDEGIYGLLSLGKNGKDAYDAVVWRLAQRIARAYQTHWVRAEVPGDVRQLRETFEEVGHDVV
ncbi:toll/interleukin-1 receptor domain-containing protein [Micromonospora sp. C31]|uniref:TIR-like protein FxsC n=1 Tax=Micromonospora sp. C31 TaxID=2824876 RepID=UPI001B37C0AA|nr:TIR-like protein FxsC [Micromonospora sp. C31]MBQ1075615.1 toll/interleukin-1 receptor domain-containing protein [Micromonospora sp. C31]